MPARPAVAPDAAPDAAWDAEPRTYGALVARVYEQAPPSVRIAMLETLLRHLSVFALIAVANGTFARIKGRNAAWQPFRILSEDIRSLCSADIVALTDRVQQDDIHTMHALADVVASAPGLRALADTSVLLTLLARPPWPMRPGAAAGTA